MCKIEIELRSFRWTIVSQYPSFTFQDVIDALRNKISYVLPLESLYIFIDIDVLV